MVGYSKTADCRAKQSKMYELGTLVAHKCNYIASLAVFVSKVMWCHSAHLSQNGL